MGDLNVRVGEMQILRDDVNIGNTAVKSFRHSKDKVVNSRGRKFLEFAADNGLLILNGRVSGDWEGENTCIQAAGASVNDIAVISYDMVPALCQFQVMKQNFSDHMPITVNICTGLSPQHTRDLALLPKLNWKNQNTEEYKSKLEIAVNIIQAKENDGYFPSAEMLVKVVWDCAHKAASSKKHIFKEKWFDGECYRLRKRSFKWLNIFRQTNSSFCRKMYVTCNKAYKNLLIVKKKRYYEDLSFKLSTVKDSKDWWTLAKEIRGKNFICGKGIDITDFCNYFQSLLNPDVVCDPILYAAPLLAIPELDDPISFEEVMSVLNKCKDNKAPGNDGVPYEFFKYSNVGFLAVLVKVYNKLMDCEQVPQHFVDSLIFPIFKKGDPNDVHNYRGLSFSNTIAKIFVSILVNRLVEWEQKYMILNENQTGFRPGYSTVDNIFNLTSIIHLNWKSGKKKLYCFFVDFKAAFDTINRSALYYKLYSLGISTKMINMIKSMYTHTKSSVWNGEMSEQFETFSGLKQGCPASPLLFSFFVNDIDDTIGGGVSIEGTSIRTLLYADDLVLIANEVETLGLMIKNLENYCKLWSLRVNLDKSKILIFNKGGGVRPRRESWEFEGREIEIVSSYKYLGVTLTPKLSFRKHMEERLANAKYSLNITWSDFISKNSIPPAAKFQVFNAVSRAIMCYGAQVWGYKCYEEVEKLQRFFLKRLLGLPQQTPNYMLQLETGLLDMYLYTLKCHLKYINKVFNEMPDHRLPKILGNKIIEKDIYWLDEWKYIMERHQIVLTTQNIGEKIGEVVEKEKRFLFQRQVEKARQSVRHDLYNQLDYDLGDRTYFLDIYSIEMIRYIFKCRGGLLRLNACPFRTNGTSECSMCNTGEPEDLQHFLGTCPILSEFRRLYFGMNRLTAAETLELLNGKDWVALFHYTKAALNYRRFLITEYNT